MSEKKIISVSAILTDLEDGLQRKDIRAKYALTVKQMSYLFNHPSLKGKKAKKNVANELEILDDTTAPTTMGDTTVEDFFKEEESLTNTEKSMVTEPSISKGKVEPVAEEKIADVWTAEQPPIENPFI